MCTLGSRQLAFLAALGRSALDPFTLDIFGVVDQLVAIGTFVGVAVDSLQGGNGIAIGDGW